ncbi:LOW QUALITY PROTEIN: apical membrane antigen, putative [Eimeria mitis]|uniref:Apical membrane antigen, putative n=1 Tax=Eimeria mitis TaxID=44415 RepID=U6K8G0_9EIME|nr:LOW QUALITY PROTEIN: apical membrane antigen, putative [Eimeria mitis]CDJ31773.1 apical membrane antigen, putative [Eimeria mitis]
MDENEKEREKEIDDALVLDIVAEPAKIEATFTDLLKHYRLRQLIDPFFIKPDPPERVVPPPNLEEIYARIEQITSFDGPPEGEEWENASKTFPFLPPLPLVLYGDVGNYCPVALRDEKWLLPGKPRLSLQVRQRVYMVFDEEKKYKFTADTRRYLPSLDKCNDANETSTLKVPPPRIAFLGSLGSEVEKRISQLSDEYGLPFLDLRSEFSLALKQQLLRMADEPDGTPDEADSSLWQLLSMNSNNLPEAQTDMLKQMWPGLQEETQQKLCQEALRSVLHPEMGPALIQAGVFTNPLADAATTTEEEGEENGGFNIGSLMDKAGRLPDCVVIFLCTDEVGVSRCLDLEKIDREAEEKKRREAMERKQKRKSRRKPPSDSSADGDSESGAGVEDEGAGAGEGEDELPASERARQEFLRGKAARDAALLECAKSFAMAGVPVLTSFCQRLLRCRAVRLSKYLLSTPMDVDAMRLKDFSEYPVLFRDRVYFPAETEEERRIFCQTPSKFLTGTNPPPKRHLPACVFLGPLNSNRTLIAKQIAEWCGAVYVSPLQLLQEVTAAPAPTSALNKCIVGDLHQGKAAAPCCTCRLIAARLRSQEARQRGFLLDGCGLEGVGVELLMELLHASPHEVTSLSRKHRLEHNSPRSSTSTEVPTSPVGAEWPGPPAEYPQAEATPRPVYSPNQEKLPEQENEGFVSAAGDPAGEQQQPSAAPPPDPPAAEEPESAEATPRPVYSPNPEKLPEQENEGFVSAAGDPAGEQQQPSAAPPPDPAAAEEPESVQGAVGGGEGRHHGPAEVVASIPPLQLDDLRPASADVRGQYPLPLDSGSETPSGGVLSTPAAASGGTSAPSHRQDMHACGREEEGEEETETPMPPLPFPLVDIVFVFDSEHEDLWTEDERLLQEEEPKTPKQQKQKPSEPHI